MKRLGVFIVVIGLLVGGCSASGSENKISDEYVEQEINKVIENNNYKNIISEMTATYSDYAIPVFEEINGNTISDSNKEEYIQSTVEFLNYINNIDPYSLGIKDKVLEDYTWDFDYHATTYAEYVLKYLNSGEKVHKDFINDYFGYVINDLRLIKSLLEPTN